jgi:hypothetical protein
VKLKQHERRLNTNAKAALPKVCSAASQLRHQMMRVDHMGEKAINAKQKQTAFKT